MAKKKSKDRVLIDFNKKGDYCRFFALKVNGDGEREAVQELDPDKALQALKDYVAAL